MSKRERVFEFLCGDVCNHVCVSVCVCVGCWPLCSVWALGVGLITVSWSQEL